jgi:hypothetical protein
MATPVSISASGTVRSLLSLGFTDQDALHELIDNALDAHSNLVRIRLSTSDHTLYIDDAGRGMNKTKLAKALCIFNGKPASDSIGIYGVGVKAGHAVLSNEETVTRILSKSCDDEDVYEIAADWPGALESDEWHPTPSEVSAKRLPLWEAGCLNPAQGTVTVIPMPVVKFNALLNDLPQLMSSIGQTYEAHLRSGSRIRVEVDGTEYLPSMTRALNVEDAPAHLRTEVPIEVWEHPETHIIRVYYLHTCLRPIWTDMVRTNPENPKKKPVRDHTKAEEQGYVRIGRFVMRSVYDPARNPVQPDVGDRPALVPGYIAFRRNGRSLRPIDMAMPATGDYEKRRIVAASCHAVDFDHNADKLVGVQVNKSDITADNICPPLLAVVKRLAAEWAGKVYETSFKVRVERGDVAFERRLKRIMKSLKQRAHDYRDEFLDDLETIITDWDGVDESDDEASTVGST